MGGYVVPAIAHRSERLVAHIALVRFVTGVNAFVRLDVAALREPFVAEAALETPFVHVEFAVQRQIVARVELFVYRSENTK